MVCIERILVSNDYGSAIQRGVADLESGATVAKLRIRLWKGLMRGAWPQSNIALDLGVIVVIDVEFWMEAWLRVLRSNSFITVAVIFEVWSQTICASAKRLILPLRSSTVRVIV